MSDQQREGFAARLEKARIFRGLSQTQLADVVGCSQTEIAHIECGGSEANTFTPAIAKALKVDAYWLVHGVGDAFGVKDESNQAPHPFVNDTWVSDDDPEYSQCHTHRIADITRAANGIKVISRIVHNSLGQPDMSGDQPLDISSIQQLLNALECLGDYVYDNTESMRETEAMRAKWEQQREVFHGQE
ncbi:helix-turn-helix domain-containing protein [Paraburkholderia sp. SIMBA_054]|uniref:helix-turn-helix domain-containing protein n=1 Tax=Paraburkholderia sp. SIMBA_054 TaxID=3085795 RepID=UPI00397B5B3D